eukprot:CAMPEP_0114345464 /NCGR_PEP_ID=MMETSP0101-20121206/12252_1 /TAXON_ID=38822 ORGANISM="Pteridomonas danica, Strain PT" /NCGR_SAMPLE_ID=MMETSP0101 /ASSEMBLY_ACC=CAM_ASM_000211 /LENGTH=234 /DNA_ID=CAMNT_0001481451 /DNA_START=66 /DNA_END=767 /DNA_ORIENTATION=-
MSVRSHEASDDDCEAKKLRVYTNDTSENVKNLYKTMREKQTYEHIINMAKKYNKGEILMKPWDAVELMEKFVDVSDPDVELPQIVHMLQTAQSIRNAGLPDWFQLVGFIHDLGKMIFIRGCDEDGTSMKEQFSIVGDTFIVGTPFSNKMIFSEFNSLNPDYQMNIYEKNIGLSNCAVAYGHDEFLYQVLLRAGSKCSIPEEGLYAIRFHSLYPWHRENEYKELENDYDMKMKFW